MRPRWQHKYEYGLDFCTMRSWSQGGAEMNDLGGWWSEKAGLPGQAASLVAIASGSWAVPERQPTLLFVCFQAIIPFL
jgi:hypothetical protein